MSKRLIWQLVLGITLTAVLVGGIVYVTPALARLNRIHVTAYFENSNGIFRGDDVYMLGVKIGEIDAIEPEATRAKITFWYDNQYKVPADARAVILSPQLITSRAIQLTPAYTGGPVMADGAVIEQDRTAVPVEWDDFRQQLEKLSSSLQPGPDGVSPLGSLINTAAGNLRGQGSAIRESILKLSQVFSTLGDHSGDIFSTIKNLSILVAALHSSTDIMEQLNGNLAQVTGLLANQPDDIGRALDGLNAAATDVKDFVADNRDSLGTASDELSNLSQAVVESMDDIKQTLHVAPTTFANFVNIYEPAHGSLTGILAANNFANPIQFICGAVEAASKLGAEKSAKLCSQYLAPIFKNRQYNFPPLGLNPFVNAQARPNEVTYSEDWMRPDFRPTPPAANPVHSSVSAGADAVSPVDPGSSTLPAEAPVATDPTAGLPGMMMPTGAGS